MLTALCTALRQDAGDIYSKDALRRRDTSYQASVRLIRGHSAHSNLRISCLLELAARYEQILTLDAEAYCHALV